MRMTDETPAPLVPVTDADRELAAYLGKQFAHWTDRQVSVTLAGEGDAYPFVQAVARHRIGASCERCRRLAEPIPGALETVVWATTPVIPA